MPIAFSEGSGLNDSIFGKSQAPIRLFLEKRGEAFEQQSIIKELFQMGKSTHYGEKMTSLTAMDEFQAVGENGAYPKTGMQEGYSKTLEHMTWKNSFSITREIIEDGKLMDLRKKPAGFVTSYYRTREKYGAAILGTAITGGTSLSFNGKAFDVSGADNQCLFYGAHPSKVSGSTQSNIYSDAFSDTALSQMETLMQNFCGDNDEILDVAPDTIIIPNLYTLKKSVFAAIGADKDPATANNGFNYQFGRWNVIVWAYLNKYITSGTAPWLLGDSKYNKEVGSLVWLDRTDLEVRSTLDENTDANVWRGYSRFIAGVNDWRAFCLGGIASASAMA